MVDFLVDHDGSIVEVGDVVISLRADNLNEAFRLDRMGETKRGISVTLSQDNLQLHELWDAKEWRKM